MSKPAVHSLHRRSKRYHRTGNARCHQSTAAAIPSSTNVARRDQFNANVINQYHPTAGIESIDTTIDGQVTSSSNSSSSSSSSGGGGGSSGEFWRTVKNTNVTATAAATVALAAAGALTVPLKEDDESLGGSGRDSSGGFFGNVRRPMAEGTARGQGRTPFLGHLEAGGGADCTMDRWVLSCVEVGETACKLRLTTTRDPCFAEIEEQ